MNQTFINDYADFCRKMSCNGQFRNEKTQFTNENDRLKTESTWSPPKVHLALELFVSNGEKDLFPLLPSKAERYNFNIDEWKAMRNLGEGKFIIIKLTDKGPCVVV